jgi:cytosine/adenosine deaminase-related metal-dependent hydrolase
MVTGKALDGSLINGGQQLTRMEALRLYTAENGWFLKEEASLGTIEAGKLADLVVLSDDYFDPKRVPDDAIGRIKSALTVVDGKVVHDTMPGPAASDEDTSGGGRNGEALVASLHLKRRTSIIDLEPSQIKRPGSPTPVSRLPLAALE